MCGRFTLTYRERLALADELGVPPESIPADYRPRFNIAPTDAHYIVRHRYEERQVLPASWGLVNSWAKDAKRAASQINARAESIETSPAFSEAFRRRRCVIPADGFFEWVGAKDARRPLWFHRPEGGLLFFAGLYEYWDRAPGDLLRSFTIITTRANQLVEPIHTRMPVLLDGEALETWLFEGETDQHRLLSLLEPAPEDVLDARPVSSRVNSVKNDDPDCLVELATLL